MAQPHLTSLRCQTESEVAEFIDEESTASSVSTCDYSDTDVESACSDFDVHTTNRYTQINSSLMKVANALMYSQEIIKVIE